MTAPNPVPTMSTAAEPQPVPGTSGRVSTTFAGLAADVGLRDRVPVDDGKLGHDVLDVQDSDVIRTVLHGRSVSDNKGGRVPLVQKRAVQMAARAGETGHRRHSDARLHLRLPLLDRGHVARRHRRLHEPVRVHRLGMHV